MSVTDPLRHHLKNAELHGTFGTDKFGMYAERFARFFGTPKFIIGQTCIVVLWVALNTLGLIHHWDVHPFILLNLLFSTQAAYAAPLILLAQTRQADRDKANVEADARHRQDLADSQAAELAKNTELTREVHSLTTTIAAQTATLHEIHRHMSAMTPGAGAFPPPVTGVTDG